MELVLKMTYDMRDLGSCKIESTFGFRRMYCMLDALNGQIW